MVALRADIAAAARTSAKVLVLGETGVGKEVVARLIHDQSTTRKRSFVAVNCSGIPETLLESELFGHARGSFTGAHRDKSGLIRQADGGTLFLDELGEMSLRMQAVLLRFTETGEVQQVGADRPGARANVRLITATNRDLRTQMAAGAFRQDLYYRLNVIQIHIPPLRDRGEDVLLLLQHYLHEAATTHGIALPSLTPDATQLLLAYRWPGNVREVRNLTERLVLRGRERLDVDDLPVEIRDALQLNLIMSDPNSNIGGSLAADAGSANQSLTSATVEALWNCLMTGEDFWSAVYPRFRAHEITRAELAALIDRGLYETRGSYRAMVQLFNLPLTDYKRFHAFLYQQQCNLPVAPYRKEVSARGHVTPRSAASRSAFGARRATVVVADDDSDSREIVCQMLRLEDYQVYAAPDGETAWGLVRRMKPDVVISDIEMPVLNGTGLCLRIKQHAATAATPVILLTGLPAEDAQQEALSAGADEYRLKPISQLDLCECVLSMLSVGTLSRHLSTPIPAKDGGLGVPRLE